MIRKKINIIASLPPYVNHRSDIISHPLINELRFNTIMPLGETRLELLKRLKKECEGKKLWIDLKGRQLRIDEFAYLPYAYVKLSRKIKVDLPAKIYFKDCVSTIVKIVGGNKLILSERPARVVGKGEPVNILEPSLVIDGFFTKSDIEYIAASSELGLNYYMLSFMEQKRDFLKLLEQNPNAVACGKIESRRGLDFVKSEYPDFKDGLKLMAARDDLYINMGQRKMDIIKALRQIIKADKNAILASRILPSLEEPDGKVVLSEISDLQLMYAFGYRTFMLGDMLCFHEDSFKKAMAAISDFIAG